MVIGGVIQRGWGGRTFQRVLAGLQQFSGFSGYGRFQLDPLGRPVVQTPLLQPAPQAPEETVQIDGDQVFKKIQSASRRLPPALEERYIDS